MVRFMKMRNKENNKKTEKSYGADHSLFHAAKEAFVFALIMLLGLIPPTLCFVYADRLGILWWILLLIYVAVMAMAVYIIYRYREITEIRGYFTKEEFEKRFCRELWLVRLMDRLHRFLLH